MSARLEEYKDISEVTGTMTFHDDWYLLEIPTEVVEGFLDKLRQDVQEIVPSDNPHVSVIKNEAPSREKEDWGQAFIGETVPVRFHPTIRNDNGFHFWVDCYSPSLCLIREHFGLPTLKSQEGIFLVNFHMTIATRPYPVPSTPRPHLRLTRQSHIDIETGMQHI